ncbi:MAG: tagaturonate epimerase family protein [Spirochaetia bacterium]
MDKLFRILKDQNLTEIGQDDINLLKKKDLIEFTNQDAVVYIRSIYRKKGLLYFIARRGIDKRLYIVSEKSFPSDFPGDLKEHSGLYYREMELTAETSEPLRHEFAFTKPISLRQVRTTIGMGDRLGLATPGHIRAVKEFAASPVLAQQSLRELSFTGRTYTDVVSDASWGVFQEGFEDGYGADGDHLKSIPSIDTALDAGMPMITLDLTEVMNPEAADWPFSKIEEAFSRLPGSKQERFMKEYSGRDFSIANTVIRFTEEEAKRCAVTYGKALDFSEEVYHHIRKKRGDHFDLEISIDETTTPTLPSHHLFIARELEQREIKINSLAPRFIGEFQKAVDYIGDTTEFQRQFSLHCDIARNFGTYKISVHSGSDKFSVYPIIGNLTKVRLHLKTAGTSWLEAVAAIAEADPDLYRKIHEKAFSSFKENTKFYHITADPAAIPPVSGKSDHELDAYLQNNDLRQTIHIAYGAVLQDPELGPRVYESLKKNEKLHYRKLQFHLGKHINLLGINR